MNVFMSSNTKLAYILFPRCNLPFQSKNNKFGHVLSNLWPNWLILKLIARNGLLHGHVNLCTSIPSLYGHVKCVEDMFDKVKNYMLVFDSSNAYVNI